MKSRLLILFYAFVSVYVMFNIEAYKKNQFQWDCSGYYLYLPAIFIYHDLGSFSFYHDVNQKYELSKGGDEYGLYKQPDGKRNDKYAIGTAVFELPFFLVARGYCLAFKTEPDDGYSTPYQFAGYATNIFFICAGLFFLRGFLRRYFNDGVTAFTLLCVAFGTNIYCYTIFAPAMSHPYGFFLFAGVLYYTDIYYRSLRPRHMYYIGALLGMVLITRSVNIVVALIPLFWEVNDWSSLKRRICLFAEKIKDLSVTLIIMLAFSMIQMSYWKYSTGHWIYYSYVDEGFMFTRPHIIKGLFSYQKGWFLYTPIALISILGLFFTWKYNRKIVPVLGVFFFVMIYVVFSWKGWWYGGSFSGRAMIEALPITGVPLAYLVRAVYEKGRMLFIKITFSVVMCLLIALNLFQSYQYSTGVIHYVLMSKKYYWRVFLQTHFHGDDRDYLMSWDDYYKAIIETEANHR